MNKFTDEKKKGRGSEQRLEFLNYFGKDRYIHQWLAEKRTALFRVASRLEKLGLAPDTISFLGIALLVGVVLYFARSPMLAVLFLFGHVLCDGLDGAYARNTQKASQSGAFTDLVCDQLGLVVVAMATVYHHLVSPLLGCLYITLYLIVVVFGVIINVLGLSCRITVTSKYFLYMVYAIWASTGENYFTILMSIFSAVMGIEVVIGYFRLKRGIRRKFDTEVRFTAGDPYSSKLNYALNVSVPMAVALALFLGANIIPLRAILAEPARKAQWTEGTLLKTRDSAPDILGIGVYKDDLLVMKRSTRGRIAIDLHNAQTGAFTASFSLPVYVIPTMSVLPVWDKQVLIADRASHLLMGIDLDASFATKSAVIVTTIPIDRLHISAMSAASVDGKPTWLVANYLYAPTTYLVDPQAAETTGFMLGGKIGSYVNGGFPRGLAVVDGTVIELNEPLSKRVIYVAPLSRLKGGTNLLDGKKFSFGPPTPDAMGPVVMKDRLVMLSGRGRVYTLPVDFALSATGGRKRSVELD